MRDILAPTRDSRRWQANVEYAAHLAAVLEGTLSALYQASSPDRAFDIESPRVAAEIVDICREEAAAALRAQEPFSQWCKSLGVRSCSWHVAQGTELGALQSAAKWHDLIVFERCNDRDDDTAFAALGAALLHSGLPCIVLPADSRTLCLDTVAIAWNATPEAARALHAALPLLRRAGRIVVIHGEPRAGATAQASLAQAEQHLRDHGLEWRRIPIDPRPHDAGPAILAAAQEAKADLLVMGAYGRTRLGEWLLGGATRHVLQAASMPVFLRH